MKFPINDTFIIKLVNAKRKVKRKIEETEIISKIKFDLS